MARAWSLGAALCVVLGVLPGCDDDRACVHDGQTLAVGESIDDIGRRLRCACTEAGLSCEDLPGAVSLLDAELPDRAPRPDARAVPDAAVADAAPDMPPVVDAIPPDAAPPSCPERRIVDGSDCPGREGAMCFEGPAFDCCGRDIPGERRCGCEARTWNCTDLVAECEADPEIGECGRRSRLCARWRNTRERRDPPDAWDGDHDLCDPGRMTDDWRAAVLERLNTYRSLAGLPPVDHQPALDNFAQECALAIFWHGTEDHQLEEFDMCNTRAAADGVEGSLISRAPGVVSVDEYMLDFGEQNFDSLSHRLYVLAPQLGPIGIGSTSLASCVYVFNGRGPQDDPPWVGWPPPGPFPIDAALTDAAGWSVHSNAINLAFADVEISLDGEPLPIDQRRLQAAGPAGWGLAWIPMGWALEVGRDYRVRVSGGLREGEPADFEYTVQPIDCDVEAQP